MTIDGAIEAPFNARLFAGSGLVIVSKAPVVSVAWWGALAEASVDAAPAFRAAWGNDRHIVAPAATYRLCSTQDIPANDARAVQPETIIYADGSNVDVDFTGAILAVCPDIAHVAVGTLVYDRVRHLRHRGGTFIGTKVGVPLNTENNAIGFISVVDVDVEDVVCEAAYEGVGSCMGGDWVVDGRFRHIRANNVGIFADFAFLQKVVFEDVRATGRGEARDSAGALVVGANNPGQKGFALIFDPPNATFNKTGLAYGESTNVRITFSSFSNFVTGVALGTGHGIRLVDDTISENPGAGGSVGLGVYIFGTDAGHYPSDIIIDGGRISGNGAATSGSALSISCPPHTPGNAPQDRINKIVLRQVEMSDNHGPALDAAPSCPFIDGITLDHNHFISSAVQPRQMSGAFALHLAP